MSVHAKRKSKPTGEDKSEITTKKRKNDLTWLTDGLAGEEPFTVLKRFIQDADEFNAAGKASTNTPDVVGEFLINGGTGKEFLALLEGDKKRKASETALIFNSLEAIFSRVSSDLSEYRSVAMKTASSILQSHMVTIYMTLAPSSSAIQVKSALRMLTSMVTLGHLTAREVITRFDFTHACVGYILQRWSLTDLPDVRSTYLTFITAFLVEDDSMVLRTMGENQSILQPIFPGLIYDPVGVLRLFLTALRDKLVSSPQISKTHKFHIFTTNALQHLAGLFFWLGPHKAPNIKGNQKDNAGRLMEPTDEETSADLSAVGQLVQSLLILLTTSHKFGIAFTDYELGRGRKGKNPRIFGLLETLGNFWEEKTSNPGAVELQSEIVVKTMQNCPDLMRPYFKAIAQDLEEIRMSPAWLDLCSLVRRVLEVQNVGVIFNPREKHSPKQVALRAASLMVPLGITQTFFVEGLSNENLNVRLAAGQILVEMLNKATEFQQFLASNPKAAMYNETEKKSITQVFMKDMLGKVIPTPTIVINSCPQLAAFKEQEGDLRSWTVFLDLKALYSQLGFLSVDDEAVIPIGQIVIDVLDVIRSSAQDDGPLERLQMALFNFVDSLSDHSRIKALERRALVALLSRCLARNSNNWVLRRTARDLLSKVLDHTGATRLEWNVWLTTLERFPEADAPFAEFCNSLPPCEPSEVIGSLLAGAWKDFGESDSSESYLAAVSCEIVLSAQDPKPVASALLKSIPKEKLNPSLKAFLLSWTKSKSKPCDPSSLGLSPFARILYGSSFDTRDSDLDALKEGWKQEVSQTKDRPDKLELVVHQALACMSASRAKGGECCLHILRLLRDLLDQQTEASLHGVILRHPLSLECFDPLNSSDAFVAEFSSMLRDALQRCKDPASNKTYQRKLVDCIERAVRGEVTAQCPETERELLFSLSELKLDELEQLIVTMVSQEEDSDPKWLPYLDMCLQRIARLRLEATDTPQRHSWPVFAKVLRLFVKHEACPALRQGLLDVISAYPEFLDTAKDFKAVLNACLDSEKDATPLCNLLVATSAELCAVLGKWLLENEDKLKSMNWRLQTLPPYLLSSQDASQVLEILHRNLSPLLLQLLTNREEYQKSSKEWARLPEFLRILISRCWSAEECRDVAVKLLAQSKTGMLCAQFVDVARRGAHYDLHVKLLLRAAVYQLKSEDPNPSELELLAEEFAWLSKTVQGDLAALAALALQDSAWSKFVKYTLRTGLRAVPATESSLPPIALRVMTNAWRFLQAGGSLDFAAPSQQVYEMITSHSDFLSVIMDEEGTFPEQKKLLLELLTVLVELNTKLCQGGQVPLLLASYQATRSATDQLILGLLRTYEKNGVVLSPYKPFLWGPAAAAHYSIQRGAATRLTMQPESGEVLALLDGERLLKTAYHFPIRLRLNQTEKCEESDDYDPRFILSLLAHILSPEYALQCAKFTQSSATSIILASLSSSCGEMRSLGWMALSRLYDQFQNATAWPERCLWLHLIECVRLGAAEQFRERYGTGAAASRQQHPPKLPNVITLFLAKSAAIMRDPAHPMYRPINNFLLIKPSLDVNQVPEFFVLLHSTELLEQRIQQRSFLLSLLRDGIRSRQDYLVCARRRVFRILLTLQPSNLLVDQSAKSMILEVVQAAVRNPVIAYDLVRNRGLLMWLDGLLLNDTTAVDPAQLLQVVETLWNTLEGHLYRKRESKEKGGTEEDALAELERELVVLEADKDDDDKGKVADQKKATPPVNAHCRKPVWDMLPSQQQVIAPWITCELIQLMMNLWRALYEADMDLLSFQTYVKLLRAVSSHFYETKRSIKAIQDTKSLHFVAPCRTLSLPLLKQLVNVSSRFVSGLPDLRDHLGAIEPSKTKQKDPLEQTSRWLNRHALMRRLTGEEEQNITVRNDLHYVISLAECGV